MIYTLALTESGLKENIPIGSLTAKDIIWYWVDFESPNADEAQLLSSQFKFHDLAVEDCLENLERPKVDYYATYDFFVIHALGQQAFDALEVDLFVGENYLVSFHKAKLREMESARQKILETSASKEAGAAYAAYVIFDKIVDYYFPTVYEIEDYLSEVNIRSGTQSIDNLIERVFEIRTDLLKIRRVVNSMKELLYRILNSERLNCFKGSKQHFKDVYDHLLRLSDIVDSNREVTSDVRDSYLSIISHRMNKIMTILTVITSVFIPLTFIAGIYGMNFDNMPELRWKYGYFIVLGAMVLICVSMILWFNRKGWLDIRK